MRSSLHFWGPLILLAALLAGFDSAPVSAQSSANKRPITHANYDSWKSIQGQVLSADGKFVGYAIMPQEGDGELVICNVESGKENRYPRGTGARPTEEGTEGAPPAAAPPAAAQRGRGGLAGQFGRPVTFTADSRFALFQLIPTKAELEKARTENAAPEAMPRSMLGILNLGTGALSKLEKVRTFLVPEEGSGLMLYQLETR